MQAIQVKFLPATNNKGTRLKASCEGGSITENSDYSLDDGKQAERLAYKLAEKLGWKVKLCGGTFKDAYYFVIIN